MSSYFAAFSYVPPLRWGSPRLWDAFDAYLEERRRKRYEGFFATPVGVEAAGTLTQEMFLNAVAAMERRERQLPPWFN